MVLQGRGAAPDAIASMMALTGGAQRQGIQLLGQKAAAARAGCDLQALEGAEETMEEKHGPKAAPYMPACTRAPARRRPRLKSETVQSLHMPLHHIS